MFGPGGDVGIMQICYQRTVADLWDWRANIDSGKEILMSSKTSAKKHLDAEAAEEGATPYPLHYWREEAIHRYNAGTHRDRDAYRVWEPGSGDGVPGEWKVVDRGGIGGYVPAVLGQSTECQ